MKTVKGSLNDEERGWMEEVLEDSVVSDIRATFMFCDQISELFQITGPLHWCCTPIHSRPR